MVCDPSRSKAVLLDAHGDHRLFMFAIAGIVR
jgi:hypothetical protein